MGPGFDRESDDIYVRIMLGRDFSWVDKIREVIRKAGGVYEYVVNICLNICLNNCDGAI